MRLAVGSIWHQTNAFARMPTGIEAFDRSRPGFNRLLGAIDAAGEASFEVVTTVDASAPPGGIVTGEAFETLTGELIDRLSAAGPLDAVILALHGAMVAEAAPSADTEIARRVRAVIGPDTPLVLLVDLRANLTPEIAETASLILATRTSPTTDTRQRGADAVHAAARLIQTGARPATAFHAVPVLVPLPAQRDGQAAITAVLDRAREIEADPRVLAATVAAGFAYADTPAAGLSVVVSTDGDPNVAAELAGQIANEALARRTEFLTPLANIETAIHAAMAAEGPVILTDTGDDPGDGASGEGTGLLWGLLDLGARRAIYGILTDPHAVAAATQAGLDAEITLDIGGRVDRRAGYPIEVRARVKRIIDGPITREGPIASGETIDLGRAVLLHAAGRHGGEVAIMIAARAHEVDDPALFAAFGLDPAAEQIVAIKSSAGYRAALPDLDAVLDVETPGITTPDVGFFNFTGLRRPIFPLDTV